MVNSVAHMTPRNVVDFIDVKLKENTNNFIKETYRICSC